MGNTNNFLGEKDQLFKKMVVYNFSVHISDKSANSGLNCDILLSLIPLLPFIPILGLLCLEARTVESEHSVFCSVKS